jgi:CubicO group peptidase (beta-lactamase class C family)
MRLSLGAASSVASAIALSLVAAPAAAVPTDFAAKADAYFKSAYPADGPGAAVIVVDDGKVVYASGQGLADVQAKRPITPATVFRLGSITKQFTSAVILQLVEEGKLSLSDPVSKFLPDYPEHGADATVSQLLNHTSGIKSYTGIPGWMEEANTGRSYTTGQLIDSFKDEPLDFALGTRHRYNNSGYVLLGAIIEKVTGTPWHVAVDERIARPLGLNTIRYGTFESETPGMAAGYSEREGKQVAARRIHMSTPHAAGALIGSVEDLARWAQALHHGRVVSPASYAKMIAPTTLPDGTTDPYAFGLRNEEVRGLAAIGHGGGIFGFDTSSIYLPGEDLFVAVFANSDDPIVDPEVPMLKLAAMAVGDPYPEFEKVDVAESEIEPLLGLYTFDGGERRFFRKGRHLFTRVSGGSDQQVFAAGGDRFFYGPTSLTWFEVAREPAGKHVMSMHMESSAEVLKSVRSGAIPADAPVVAVARPVLEQYAGSYRADRGMVTISLSEGGDLTIRLGGGQPIRLLATSDTEFRADGVDRKVVFHRSGERITHIVVHQGKQEIRADRQ